MTTAYSTAQAAQRRSAQSVSLALAAVMTLFCLAGIGAQADRAYDTTLANSNLAQQPLVVIPKRPAQA